VLLIADEGAAVGRRERLLPIALPISSTMALKASATRAFPSFSTSFSCFSNSRRSSSERLMRRENFSVAMTIPSTPEGTSRESFFTSSPARPKIAWRSFSSGVNSVLLFGDTFPTRMSPGTNERADLDDAPLVEVVEGPLADVRNVAGEFLAA
jgi:hypothetical protein